MQYLELRRHSTRNNMSIHLSQAGVSLARKTGQPLGPFVRVITSPSQWTFETAIAMGFSVDEYYQPVPLENEEWKALHELLPPGMPFVDRMRTMRDHPLAHRFADLLRAQWAGYATVLPEDACMLIITHSGYIDDSAVACLPNAPHITWGDNFAHCEGIRLAFNAGAFVGGKLLRG